MARPSAIAARHHAEEQADLQRLVEYARVSRDTRQTDAERLRQWYELGTDGGTAAANNKLRSHLDRLASYIWSADSVRFGLHLPTGTGAQWLGAAQTARDEFRLVWGDSGADLTIGLALEWSLVYGSQILKVRPDPQGFAVDLIDPWDFGVTREDMPNLEDQDVLCHWYVLSVPQFDRWIDGHPREAELKRLASGREHTPTGGRGGSIVVTGLTGAFPSTELSGSVQAEVGPAFATPSAEVREPVYAFVDVWQRRRYADPRNPRESFEDWRVTTAFADDQTIVVRRRNPILGWLPSPSGVVMPGELPFAILAPRPLPNYLWGRSELFGLIGLQLWRESQIAQMRDVITRQLDPAKFFSGVPDYLEAGRAMSAAGGSFGSSEPTAKMETIQVQVGQEAFGMLSQIDSMFEDASGIPSVLANADQPPGVRANNQLITLAGIGAGRVRHMALQLEATLSRVATLGFRITQRNDAQMYTAADGTKFLLAQLPPGTSLQVSAHSASPIFAEQIQQKALELHQRGVIDGEWLIELLDVPYREEIKDVSKRLAEAKAKFQERFMELELEKVRRRRGKM